ncbi:abc-type maltose transport system, permease component [Agrilactobacillus composti DSM 18527 = JCM 14202]|uniref:Abc-type maltose transport system, permease component n=1 Tax=Agrilactobacillus composti DSM 18527 = JCM 14202 TaxID=1423734 RepID=X0PUG3_9LACO|nr:carbohydrate ABC transporter permease [Agrilactobacillus composti]KRM35476.1 abc-type maltose transport system, permease component [Agrilactobacillus composti DSM 18527 = JCM 14202]GAF41001.1 multiple sugar ABC transporter, membrane-spanning permease protein MsmG [Agrilactobacillus composti DSM 18527 = JCM 14202]
MKKTSKLVIALVSFLLGLLWIFPFYLILTNSFKTPKGIFASVLSLPSPATGDNYVNSFKALDFLRSLGNSLIITVVGVVLIIVFSAMAAYALQRNHSKISGGILMLFVSAMLIPFQTVMIPLTANFGRVHMLNMWGLIFMYIGFQSSLSIFLYQGTIASIPVSMDESAELEGANRLQTFFKIIFPMLTPITTTVGILNIIALWNDYLLPSLVLPQNQYTIPLQMFFFFGQYTKQWHLALAGLALSILPVIIFYAFAQRYIIKGVTDGAVK